MKKNACLNGCKYLKGHWCTYWKCDMQGWRDYSCDRFESKFKRTEL